MSKAEIFNLALVALFIICSIFINWTNKHETKNNQWLETMKDFATSYVHGFNQTDTDGREKMKNVISAVKSMMEKKGFTVDPEDEKLIEAIAQTAYDKMINDSKKTGALDKIATDNERGSLDPKTVSDTITDTLKNVTDYLYEGSYGVDNDEVTDLQKESENTNTVEREG